MAEYTHDEQVEIVRKALSLETAIKVEQANVELIKSQEFDRFPSYAEAFPERPPAMPRRQICPDPEPVVAVLPEPPKTAYSVLDHIKKQPYWIIVPVVLGVLNTIIPSTAVSMGALLLMLVSLIATIACIVGLVITYKTEVNRRNLELANTPDYLQAVSLAQQQAAQMQAQAELAARQEQARLDAQYDAEMDHYNNVLVPSYEQQVAANKQEYAEMQVDYEAERAAWNEKRHAAIELLEHDIAANEDSLADLYDSTGLISLHYREIPLLAWLYDDMRTSDHDIRYATELLDRDRQRIVTETAGTNTVNAIDALQKQAHEDALGVMELQGVQVRGLQNLEQMASEILYTTEDIYTSSKKIIFHQRVNTVDIAAREWRRRKAMK